VTDYVFLMKAKGRRPGLQLVYLNIRKDDHGQNHHEGQGPYGCAHHLGHAGVSPLGAADRMNHSQVPIDGHDRQAEDGGELVHGVRGHHHAAKEGAKRPIGEHVLGGDQGEPDNVELIRHRQVQDVAVGDRLHFGVAQHHVDGQGVARQTHQEDCEGDECGHHSAAALEGDALGGQVGGDVEEAQV